MSDLDQSQSGSTAQQSGVGWTLAALGVSLTGAAGSLWLSLGMDLKACPLCYYQRTFMLAVVGVLVVGLLAEPRRTGLLNALALPAATGGLGVAVFHVYLELSGKLECPAGVFGIGTAPQQSLDIFVVLLVVFAVPVLRQRRIGSFALSAIGLVLGLAFALGTIRSAPPLPSPPLKPYGQPLEKCRPPYDPPNGEADAR